MTFDALDRPQSGTATPSAHTAPAAPSTSVDDWGNLRDPEPGWAKRNPDLAMRYLFVAQRDCAALDELLD